jgi:hypothetical protein
MWGRRMGGVLPLGVVISLWVLVSSDFCHLPDLLMHHHGLGSGDAWRSRALGKYEAAYRSVAAASTVDTKYQACGAAPWEGHYLCKALGEMALLSSDFPLGASMVVRCDNKAALSLCQDHKEENA